MTIKKNHDCIVYSVLIQIAGKIDIQFQNEKIINISGQMVMCSFCDKNYHFYFQCITKDNKLAIKRGDLCKVGQKQTKFLPSSSTLENEEKYFK